MLDKLESSLVRGPYGRIATAGCVELEADEILFLLSMAGRSRERVVDRLLGVER